jgi:hypothetical protein
MVLGSFGGSGGGDHTGMNMDIFSQFGEIAWYTWRFGGRESQQKN